MVCMVEFTVMAFIFGFIQGSRADTIQLSFYNKEIKSQCVTGYLDGIDRYIYNASVSYSDSDFSTKRIMTFMLKTVGDTDYQPECLINIYLAGCNTNPSSTSCYCRQNVSSNLEIIFNATAKIQNQGASLQLIWQQGFGPDVVSNIVTLPVVSGSVKETLEINNNTVALNNCNIKVKTPAEIYWCVTNLKSHNLSISTNGAPTTSQNDCVTKTITEKNSTFFNISYVETDECQRKQSYQCYLEDHTTDSSTTGVPLNVTLESASNNSSSDVYKGIVGAHVSCTGCVAIISIIAIIIILKKPQSKILLICLCCLLALFEIAQLILVIVAGTDIEYDPGTSINIWKILIIYQCLVYIVFIVLDSIILIITPKNIWSQPLVILVVILSIHSWMLALPVLLLFKCTSGTINKTESHNLSNFPRNPVPDKEKPENFNGKPKPAREIASPTAVVSLPIISNDVRLVSATNNYNRIDNEPTEEKTTRTKKRTKKRKVKNRTEDINEITENRANTASDIDFYVENQEISSLKDNNVAMTKNSCADVNNSVNRLPSIETTSKPNVTIRNLPPLKKKE